MLFACWNTFTSSIKWFGNFTPVDTAFFRTKTAYYRTSLVNTLWLVSFYGMFSSFSEQGALPLFSSSVRTSKCSSFQAIPWRPPGAHAVQSRKL